VRVQKDLQKQLGWRRRGPGRGPQLQDVGRKHEKSARGGRGTRGESEWRPRQLEKEGSRGQKTREGARPTRRSDRAKNSKGASRTLAWPERTSTRRGARKKALEKRPFRKK